MFSGISLSSGKTYIFYISSGITLRLHSLLEGIDLMILLLEIEGERETEGANAVCSVFTPIPCRVKLPFCLLVTGRRRDQDRKGHFSQHLTYLGRRVLYCDPSAATYDPFPPDSHDQDSVTDPPTFGAEFTRT
jgi:hypothetical protein